MNNNNNKLLKLCPAFKDYIWGGTKLNSKYNKNSGFCKTAESWELSVHPDGTSIISGGELDGVSLAEYIKSNPEVLGVNRKTDELPILVKLIDAEDKLSIQVHPNDEQAKKWESQNGKTEMWYVVEADEGAEIVYGVKENITKEQLKNAISDNTVMDILDSTKSKKGDVFFVDAGTIHAIGKGNLIAEIQQNSNVTYRLYDYDRRDKNGNPRELHIDKGIMAAVTEKTVKRKIPVCSDNSRLLGTCEYFAVRELAVEKTVCMECHKESYQALIVVEGKLELSNNEQKEILNTGDTIFLPAGFGKYTLSGCGKILVTENPPKYFVNIEINDTYITAIVKDEHGLIYGSSKENTKKPCSNQEVLESMAKCAKDAAFKSGISWEQIESVAIGYRDNDADFSDNSVVEDIQNKLCKRVYIENNA